MIVKKLIPLATLIVNTNEGIIQLKSNEVNLEIDKIEFKKRIYSKFSNIKITGKNIGVIQKSTGNKNPELTKFMTEMYNLVHLELNHNAQTNKDEFLQVILTNARETILEYR